MKSLLWMLLLVASAGTASTDQTGEPGLMLREGTWDGGVGTYDLPPGLSATDPKGWPKDQWFRISIGATTIKSERLAAPQISPILQSIIKQIDGRQSDVSSQSTSDQPVSEIADQVYLRVPGSGLREGAIPLYLFKNGTSMLRPKLDYVYELKLGEQPFSFVVRNGLRSSNGTPYGSGAQYTIEYDGNRYEYSLGEYGWDSTVSAIADLDGDGKPDFLIHVGGNNSGYQAILLSSKAKPGKNPATASLFSEGC